MISVLSDKSSGRFGREGSSLDVRVRLLMVIISSAAVLILSNPWSLILLFVAGAIYMGLLGRFRVQAIFYIVLIVLSAMSVGFLKIMGIFIPMMRSTDKWQMVIPFLRMAVMGHVVMALALSMQLRNVLSTMKSLRLPRVLYLPLAVTVRFIPGLIDDLKQIRDCLKLRGYRGWELLKPRLWLLPVVFRSLHLSDELAIAAELKAVGYGSAVKMPSPSLKTTKNAIALFALAVVMAAAVFIQVSYPPLVSKVAMGHGHHGSSGGADVSAEIEVSGDDISK